MSPKINLFYVKRRVLLDETKVTRMTSRKLNLVTDIYVKMMKTLW